MVSEVDSAVLNTLLGRELTAWELCDGGMHFQLDDGRTLILTGSFALAVFKTMPKVVH